MGSKPMVKNMAVCELVAANNGRYVGWVCCPPEMNLDWAPTALL